MQLRERHWRIFSLSGTLETVRGRGVVGQVGVDGVVVVYLSKWNWSWLPSGQSYHFSCQWFMFLPLC